MGREGALQILSCEVSGDEKGRRNAEVVLIYVLYVRMPISL